MNLTPFQYSRYLWRFHVFPIKCLLGTAFLLLGVVPLLASCRSNTNLRLNAVIKHGELVAVLKNISSQPVRTVGEHITPFPGSGGFYIQLQNVNGDHVKYCAMINIRNPSEHKLVPAQEIVYRVSLVSLENQYCLGHGTYVGRVIYYNAYMFGKIKYSRPIVSEEFKIIIPEK